MATAKPKPKTKTRRELAHELVALRRTHSDIFDQMDSLKASLIVIATDEGASFKEVFPEEGSVSVSGAKEARFKGEVPEVNVDVFRALTEARRTKLIESGLVTVETKWSKADHGRVTVKTF